jgi:hypothetical protein
MVSKPHRQEAKQKRLRFVPIPEILMQKVNDNDEQCQHDGPGRFHNVGFYPALIISSE